MRWGDGIPSSSRDIQSDKRFARSRYTCNEANQLPLLRLGFVDEFLYAARSDAQVPRSGVVTRDRLNRVLSVERPRGFNDVGCGTVRGAWPMLHVERAGFHASQGEIERQSKVRCMDRYRPVDSIVIRDKHNRRRCTRSRGDENGNERRQMARLVKVLQVERIIPNLVDRSAIERAIADLKLQYEDDRVDQENGVNPPAHPGYAELQEERAIQSHELALQQADLFQPGVSLRRNYGEVAVGCEPSYDGVGIRTKEFRNGRAIPGSGRRFVDGRRVVHGFNRHFGGLLRLMVRRRLCGSPPMPRVQAHRHRYAQLIPDSLDAFLQVRGVFFDDALALLQGSFHGLCCGGSHVRSASGCQLFRLTTRWLTPQHSASLARS